MLEESCIMPICSAPARVLTSAGVRDVGLSQHGAFFYNAAWLA
jgi:hypothetical protein